MRKYSILCIQRSMFKILRTISTTLSVGKHNPEIGKKKRHICFLKMIFTDNQIISHYILINFHPCIQSDVLVYFQFLDFFIVGHILGQLYGQWVVPLQLKIIEGLSPFPPSPGPVEWMNCHGWEDNRCVWKNGAVLYFFRSLPKTQRVTSHVTIISALFWRT